MGTTLALVQPVAAAKSASEVETIARSVAVEIRFLKYNKLNDRAGAIQDFRQAARLFQEQGNTQLLQLTIKALQQLGATE